MNDNSQPKITPRTTDLLLEGGIPITAVNLPWPSPPSMKPRDPLRPEKVAIIGTAPSSRLLAPFGDQEWTIWATSPGNMMGLGRIDAWIEVHNNFLWPEYRSYGEPYVKWLNDQPFPVLAADLTLFPRAIPFPWKKLVEDWGPYFFTSTFAWAMAYALNQGVKEIGLYGIDMSSKDEYILQRPGGHYFVEMAKKRGVKIVVPHESDLLQPPPLYGISDGTRFGRKMAARELEVKGRIAEMQNQLNALQGQIAYLNGAAEDLWYQRNVWGGLGEQA